MIKMIIVIWTVVFREAGEYIQAVVFGGLDGSMVPMFFFFLRLIALMMQYK